MLPVLVPLSNSSTYPNNVSFKFLNHITYIIMNRQEVLDLINEDGYELTFLAIKDAIVSANADIEEAQLAIKSAEETLASQQKALYWFADIAKTNNKLTAYKENKGLISYQVVTSDDKQWRIDVESSTPYAIAVLAEVTPVILADATAGTERGILQPEETEGPGATETK